MATTAACVHVTVQAVHVRASIRVKSARLRDARLAASVGTRTFLMKELFLLAGHFERQELTARR